MHHHKFISGTGFAAGLLGAGLCLAAFTLPAATPLMNFQFNEGAGLTTVDSVAKTVGTLGYAPPLAVTTNSPSGAAGDNVVGFNQGVATNNSCIIVDDSSNPILAFATNAPFTMEAWVNREVGDTRTYEGIGAYGFSYKMGLTDHGQFVFTLFGIVDLPSGYSPPAGEWHHLAAAWQPGTGVALYHDGILITNIAETRVPRAYRFNTLSIGAEQPGSTALQGMVDRFRIHKGVLAAADLDSDPKNPKAPTTNTLVAYSFDENAAPWQSAAATVRPALPFDTTAPTFTTDTPSGMAGDYSLSITNGQRITVPDANTKLQLDTNNPSFTLQAWVKPMNKPKARMVLFYSKGPGGGISLSVTPSNTVQITTLGVADVPSKAAIPANGNWHHIAAVHNNKTNLLFYVDGVLGDTINYTNGVLFSGSGFTSGTNQFISIGSEPTGALPYSGMLDRLSVTSGALSPAQLDDNTIPQPQVMLAGSLDGGVGVTFDRQVDPATATNVKNYAVTGATVMSATLYEGKYVALTLAGVPGPGFTVTVTGVKDLAGNAISGKVVASGQVSDLTSADLDTPGADPLQPGYAVALGNNGYLVAGGGSDIYNNADGFHFVYTEVEGDFDVRARVEWMNPMQGGANDTWGKAGLMVRETLTAGSRNVHVHTTRADGQNHIDTTWRDTTGGSTVGTTIRPAPVPYPNGWIRLVRADATKNEFISYTSTNGVNWDFGTTHTIPGGALPAKVYVGMDVTSHDNTGKIPLCEAVFQQFSVSSYPQVPARNYGIGLKFGADAATTAATKMSPGDYAGVPTVAQPNWNNLNGTSGTSTNVIVGDLADDRATNTSVVVTFASNGTWASTGEGEENNQFPAGADRALMTGYLDTGAPSTTSVTISNLPPQLTSGGYDVYVYAMGGNGNQRGGGYRVLDASTKAVLKDYVRALSTSNANAFVEVPVNGTNYGVGNFMVFSGLNATNITIEATTDHGLGRDTGANWRAPLNAIQLVGPASAAPPPRVPAELGQTVNGFQDDFTGFVRDPNWIAVGPGGDNYQQLNGVLHVTTMSGDPNHLIYVGPGGSNTTQEVLARVRVISFGSGDPSRGGIATCVSTGATGHATQWIGYNLNLRNNSENFNGGPSTSVHFKMLDDLRSWGPQTSYGWNLNTWYWMRLRTDPSKSGSTNNVFAKTWLADGLTPEPAGWDIEWNDTQTPFHGGWAGITGTSGGGLSEFEVSYILIKCATLPPISVNFNVAPLPFAYVRSVSPAMGATSVDPTAPVQAVIVDGANPIDPNSVTLRLNNVPVDVYVNKVAGVTTVTYTPNGLQTPNSTLDVTLGYVENGAVMSGQWSFTVAPYTVDLLHGYVGAIKGPAFFSSAGGGHTGKPGDYAINFGEAGVDTSVHVADGSFLNLAAASDVMSISLWVKRISTNDVTTGTSAFWGVSPSSSGTERGYQAHIPWSDKNLYFDTAGCCDGKTQRISASITNFAGYKAVGNDGFWTNWHNLVFVKNTTNKFIYIDGVLFLQGTNTAALPHDFTELYMGTDNTGTNNIMKGLIDDFAVYASAVSAADAARLAGGTPPIDLTGETLLAYWNFDDADLSSLRSYSVGLKFGADAGTTAVTKMSPTDVAGVPSVAQANWNNLNGANGTNIANLVTDLPDNTASSNSVTVWFTSNGTWASTGEGEENNGFVGTDRALMAGYLDTGAATTTTVTISNLPPVLTAHGYNVYVYALGGVDSGRSGGYRILDASTKAVLKDYVFATGTSNATYYVQTPVSTNPTQPGVGNYLLFTSLTATNIIVEATTEHGYGGSGTPRAPINAIQLVAPPAVFGPPADLTLNIVMTTAGLKITYSGILQSADELAGPWTDVPGSSPLTVSPNQAMKFYRVRQ